MKLRAQIVASSRRRAERETDRATYQAMEGFVHNLNTMHSRAGAQTPFSSINYGTDTSPEGRMAIRNVLLATDAGLGHGETAIFPIHIFKVKEGVNYNEGDPNYDLFKLSMKVSAKRLFPNYVFLDSPFNLQYYKPGTPRLRSPRWAAVPGSWATSMIPAVRSPIPAATSPSPRSTAAPCDREPWGREAFLPEAGCHDGAGQPPAARPV